MIRILFFDIDGTLLDFHESARLAMIRAFQKHALPYEGAMYEVFRAVNADLWTQIENGTLTREEMHRTRWARIFPQIGVSSDAVAFETDFMHELDETAVEIPHAVEALSALSARYTLCAASNASRCQQRHRLALAGMLPFFSRVFTSEEIGAPKPSRAFFDACFAEYPGVLPEETAMIGDSLHADVGGGILYGMKTCWFNRQNAPAPTENAPDWTIRSLRELTTVF